MRYRVKTPEGELTYESFGEVEKAYLAGLVDPTDEVQEEGASKWRKASSIPQLVQARRTGNQAWGGTQAAWILIAIVFGSAALYLISRGKYAIGFTLALLLGTLLTNVTYRAFKRTKPH